MRLYLVTGERGGLKETVRIVAGALKGGVDVVQLRKKELDRKQLVEIGRELRSLTNDFDTVFIVNDHPEVAIECDADGVHLGQEDGPIDAVRAMPGFRDRLVGRSTHSLDQALRAEAEGADYLGVGPLFATPTKPGRPAVGTSLVGVVADSIRIPFVAIGGIDASNAGDVVAAGAKAIAVVRAVYDAVDPEEAAQLIGAQMDAGLKAGVR
jgi:thiamine-phosphate pyrophosphorylase